MNIFIKEATENDREFIIWANKKIDEASFIEVSKLENNIDEDLFQKQKCVCLIAKIDERYAGMILFSPVYWADRGEGIYVSQVFVEEEFRCMGVMKTLFKCAINYFKDTKFMTCLVSEKNLSMLGCMGRLGYEDEGMISFAKNKEDFDKIWG